MSLSANYPALAPNLLLDFANTKTVDPRITVTRASTATYFDQLGVLQTAQNNVPRIDFNPTTYACNGLLVEEQRTNSYTYSEELNNPAWTANGVTVSANAAISPAGTMTADNIIPSASETIFKELQQNFSVTSGTTYTFSVFAKSNGYRYVQLIGTSASFGSFAVNYDLNTGTETAYTAGTSTVLQRSITPINNGWYRLSVSVTSSATNTTSRLACDIIPASDSARGVSWTGNGTSGVLMWGMQVEAGAFATSYIPTVAATVTRQADAISMTGTAFSGWYNNLAGTFYAQFLVPQANTSGLWRVFSGNVSNTPQFFNNSGTYNWGYSSDGTSSLSAPVANVITKFAGAYAANDVIGAVNGTLGSADTSVTTNTPTVLTLGAANSTANRELNGWLQRLSYYPLRNTNAQLQALTGT